MSPGSALKTTSYCLLVLLTVVYVVICPFSKVEESFNMQAIHDLLIYGPTDLEKFDHFEFPGVVPRTFIGPLLIAAPLWPISKLFNAWHISKFYLQIGARIVLGLMVMASSISLLETTRRKCQVSDAVISWTVLAICSQFHFIFYASRTLPNVFAIIFVLQAFRHFMACNLPKYIIFSLFAVIVFRAEVVLLLGPLGLWFMLLSYSFRPSFGHLACVISQCLFYGGIFLGLTLAVDSYFWGKSYMWPEGTVLWFNTVLNKSSQWGTSPFPWYFYSVLPRALLTTLVFIPIAFVRREVIPRQVQELFLCSCLFIGLFSFLPHKELRFIIYVFPIFNLVAAFGCQAICLFSKRPCIRTILRLVVVGHLLANLLLTTFNLYAAVNNYPGGQALQVLHKMLPPTQSNQLHQLHIDVYSAETGVSRFGQVRPDLLIYNKTEDLSVEELEKSFDFHLIEIASKDFRQLMATQSFTVFNSVDGITILPISRSPPFIKFKLEPKIAVLLKKTFREGS